MSALVPTPSADRRARVRHGARGARGGTRTPLPSAVAPVTTSNDDATELRHLSRVDVAGPLRRGAPRGDPLPRPDRRASPSRAGGFFPIIRRRATLIAAVTGIAVLVGWGLARQTTPTYEARADLLIGPLNADIATVRAASAATSTYVEMAAAPTTIEAVSRATGIGRGQLASGLEVTTDPEARIIRVRARADTAQDAADAANGVAQHLIRLAAEDPSAPAAGRLDLIDEATPRSSPVSPGIEVIAPLAAAGGLFGALALVMALELVGDTAGSVTEVRRAARTPGLTLPASRRRRTGTRSGDVVATHLDLVRPGLTSVLLTGTTGRDGDGRLVRELAASWAAVGHRVVIVDAGAGETSAAIGLDDRPGVREALAGGDVVPVALGGGVEALGAPRRGPLGTVDPSAARRVIDHLVAGGARVVVHAPPLTAEPATLGWARAVDSTVLVSRRDTGRREPLTQATDALRRIGADVACTVLQARRGGRLTIALPRLWSERPGPASPC